MSNTITILPQTPSEVRRRLEWQQPAGSPTFALYTLGCKVNQYDSHEISRALQQRGFRRVEFREVADLYVIDTCTVTAEADRKSRKAAGRAQRNNPDALVAVTGCAASYDAGQFRRVAPQALVIPNSRKLELPELLYQKLLERPDWGARYRSFREQMGSEPMPASTRERAVLKIQDGCNHRCAFCIIPTVRGVSTTKSPATVIAEGRQLVLEGARELVVTGVSMGDWGHTPNTISDEGGTTRRVRGNRELCKLLRSLAAIEGLERLRVSSLDPADVDDEFLETVAHTPRICPHIHLALQAGGAATLRRMRRRYTPEHFLRVVRQWRQIRPDGGLTTDIIVGFPGETAEDFEASLQVARESRFSAIHVFPYSPRAGTAAAALADEVQPQEQARRVDTLLSLAKELAAEYAGQFVGQTAQVLLESVDASGRGVGLIPQYLHAEVEGLTYPVVTGDVVDVEVRGWNGERLTCVAMAPDSSRMI